MPADEDIAEVAIEENEDDKCGDGFQIEEAVGDEIQQ